MMEILTVHKMRRTDRLEMLSAYYHVPVCMIMRANSFTNPEDIFSCKELKIPKKCFCLRCQNTPEVAKKSGNYTVEQEDTIFGIAKRFGVTMHIILKANGIKDPSEICVGQKLRIPVVSGKMYCVRPGESIEDIANRHNMTVKSIREKNCMDADDSIRPGMQLLLN